MLGALRDGLPVDIDKLGPLAPGTIIRVLATTDVLKELIDECGFHIAAEKSFGRDPDLGFATQTKETIVMKESESVGKTIGELNANKNYGLTLLGISRTNSKINEYLPDVTLKAGDILLVHSPESDDTQALADLGWIPLEDRPLQVTYKHSFLPTIFFLSAIGISAIGLIPVHIALVAALAATAVLERITLRDLYSTIDWPIIVLLGTMIPVGRALESTGLTQEIAELLTTVLTDLPVYGVIALIIAVAMTLSNVVNNSATAILIAPIALDLSKNLDVNPDSLLMAAAVGASCCFLTPIGHQSNLIVMNSGGYKFGDYWKLGLPVTLAALVVGTGSILIFWPT